MTATAFHKIREGILDAHAVVALEARAIDAETRNERARVILSEFASGLGDAPFGLADVVVRALNELEGN